MLFDPNDRSSQDDLGNRKFQRRAFLSATAGAVLAAGALGQISPAAAASPKKFAERHLMFNKWNFGPTPLSEYQAYVDEVANSGFTAMKVHVPWFKVVSRSGHIDFTLFDQQVDYILSKGLKCAIGIDLLRTFSDGQDAILSADQVMLDPQGRPNIATNNQNLSQFSFASRTAVARATDFVSLVTSRYHRRAGDGILFYETTMTPFEETEYWNQVWDPQLNTFTAGHYDYSAVAVSRFQSWLQNRYGTVGNLSLAWAAAHSSFATVPAPTSFQGPAGVDWYLFRHTMLADALKSFAEAVHGVSNKLRYSLRFGSTFDTVSSWRGTVLFPELARYADVVHVDDAPRYNHPFAMDLLNSSLRPNVWTGNEIDGPKVADDATYHRQATESFQHGGTIVNVANWDITSLRARRALFQSIASEQLGADPLPKTNQIVVPVSAAQELANGNSNGFQAIYNQLSENGTKRVRVPLENDLPGH
ncbi:hypothetical protein J2T10_003985 [Paenarthrobacter nicotinovorans]|jgi:hypothetical protein|uniref:Glycoside hydrolase family 42 N-terminal domain-containing protein n=1 Tax=Paenarthrobacter nicotinovorans TaxID=29320 RepID=A0ABT9TRK5_PAENI|nr:beta-galactosidase [Paenarthrobacter nicotinovorans]MDQ0104311.1 hypothetical protein [Paenarthrobacter nicotinovorans]GAT88811.1 hypothetical protein CVCC1112_3470 [Paenarthrobacter nicotinovorans]